MSGLLSVLNLLPAKREIAAVLAFLVVLVQAWNIMAGELGHGACLFTSAQIAEAMNAASTCAADWTLKIPDTVNAVIMAILGGGVVAGKHNDKAEVKAEVMAAVR